MFLGDSNLLTIQAFKLIMSADVIISDRLISKDILNLVPSTTKLLIANKAPGKQAAAQEELNNWALGDNNPFDKWNSKFKD